MKNLNHLSANFLNWLKSNPKYMAQYVLLCQATTNVVILSATKLLKHSLQVQGIDTDMNRYQRLYESLKNVFDKTDYVDYDNEDNEILGSNRKSWLEQKNSEFNQKAGKELSSFEFKKLTDISKLEDAPEPVVKKHEKAVNFAMKKVTPPKDGSRLTKNKKATSSKKKVIKRTESKLEDGVPKTLRDKLDRANKMVASLVENNLCQDTAGARHEQLNQLLKLDDSSMDALERVLERQCL